MSEIWFVNQFPHPSFLSPFHLGLRKCGYGSALLRGHLTLWKENHLLGFYVSWGFPRATEQIEDIFYGRGFVRFAEFGAGHLHTGEAESSSCSACEVGRLSSPSLALKAWGILGEAGEPGAWVLMSMENGGSKGSSSRTDVLPEAKAGRQPRCAL